MGLSKKPYKGTRDFFPPLKRKQDFLFNKMKSCAEIFGYEPYDGPLLEEVELYKAKSGEELINEQIYSFLDRGEREVAIRPEMTPTLARMVAQIHKETPKPIRWYSIPNLYRYERPQKGRLREHWQFNCDIFGAPEGKGEIEIFQVLIQFFKSLGANEKHFEILVNDRKLVDAIFTQVLQIDESTAYQLYKIIDKSKKIDEAAQSKMLENTSLSQEQITVFFEYLQLESFQDVIEFCESNGLESQCRNFIKFLEKCEELGIQKYINYDASIVRGLDYYTGIVFEVFDKNPENRRAICGGGAYDGLMKIFNEPLLPGVGFGMGDVTLSDFLETHKLLPEFNHAPIQNFISFQSESAEHLAWKLASNLRQHGLNTEVCLESIRPKKVFNIAEKKDIPFVFFFGEDELRDKTVQIKNLKTKETKTVHSDNINEILEFVKKN